MHVVDFLMQWLIFVLKFLLMVALVNLYHASQLFWYIIRMMEHKGAFFNMAYFNSQHNIASVFTFITYYNLLFILAYLMRK